MCRQPTAVRTAMLRNTAPAAPAPNTGPGYWYNVSGAVHIIDFD